MAAWPDLDELKRVLNVESDDLDGESESSEAEVTYLSRALAAGIAYVKGEVGEWTEDDVPDNLLAQAALRMAELIATRPDALAGLPLDPTYQRLIRGHRRRFAIG